MDLFGIIAGNLYVWLGLAILCVAISIGIIISSVNKVRSKGLEGALDMLSEQPGQVAKSAFKTWLSLQGFHVVTVFFLFLFILSLILNAAVWVKHS